MVKKKTESIDGLTITNVQVYPVKATKQNKMIAIARVVLNEALQLTGLSVMDGANGYFVAYPLDPRNKSENYRSIYYPLSRDLRIGIEEAVLAKYQEVIAESKKK